MFKSILTAGAFALAAHGACAEIVIKDAYARSATPNAMAGAAFMVIENTSDEADRLIDARSDIAKRVELHTHMETDGVMRMIHVKEGFEIPAAGHHMLMRGGDHVMFMGLNQSLNQGDKVEVTLSFEKAGDVVVEIPIDHERKPEDMAPAMDHNSDMKKK